VDVGAVYHERAGGLTVQFQSHAGANVSALAMPITAALTGPRAARNPAIAPLLLKARSGEWARRLAITLRALAADLVGSSVGFDGEEDEAGWAAFDILNHLLALRVAALSNTSWLAPDEHALAPWVRHVLVPQGDRAVRLADVAWGPEVSSRCCARRALRARSELAAVQVAALTHAVTAAAAEAVAAGEWTWYTASLSLASHAEVKSLVQWAVVVLRSRAWRLPDPTHWAVVPLLDSLDMRTGVHMHRAAHRRFPTAELVFDAKSQLVHLVTRTAHSRGAYPLVSPVPFILPADGLSRYGFVDHATERLWPLCPQRTVGDWPCPCDATAVGHNRTTGAPSQGLLACAFADSSAPTREEVSRLLAAIDASVIPSDNLVGCRSLYRKGASQYSAATAAQARAIAALEDSNTDAAKTAREYLKRLSR
jgi:hypothetical protein